MHSFFCRIAAASKVASRSALAVTVAALSLILTISTSNPAAAMNIQKIKTPGGIEAWLVEEHSVPMMALRYAFDGGSSQDPVGKEGVANFLTAMMDEGAGDLKSEDYQERMEELAMRMQYEDSKDAIYGSFETLSVNRDKAVELLKLSVQNPRFDTDAVVRIRQQLLANLAYADKDPDKVAQREWYAQAFAGHPYARSSNGTMTTVSSITHDDLAAYHKRTFARDNLKIVAVGDITPAELGKLVDDVFGGLPAKADLIPVAKTQPLTGGGQQVIEMGVPQSVAVFGLGAMPRKDPDFLTAFVVNHILGGGGFSAKLMEEVREKRGLAYSVYTYLQPYQHTVDHARQCRDEKRSDGRKPRYHPQGIEKDGRRGADGRRSRCRQVVSYRLLRVAFRYRLEDRRAASGPDAGRLRPRVRREPQQADRCHYARRRKAGGGAVAEAR